MSTQTMVGEPVTASRLPASCFKLGSITALIGVSLRIYMGISHDHSLAPVHVHLNLICWVSMCLGYFIGRVPLRSAELRLHKLCLAR